MVLFVLPQGLWAQGTADPTSLVEDSMKKLLLIGDDDKIRQANLDLSVPTSPAFTVLGITPETVIRPTSPRQFATALLNGADPNGNFQMGFALETAPYLLFAGNELALKQYRMNPKGFNPIRQFARAQFSLATTKGTSEDDKSFRLATGLTLTPWDVGDPRNDDQLLDCFDKRLRPVHAKAGELLNELAPQVAQGQLITEEDVNKKVAKLEPDARIITTKCREEARVRNWNASSWNIGIAPTWTSESGDPDDLKWSGAAFWTSLAYGFEGIPGLENSSQIILHARYRSDELFPNPDQDNAFIKQDTLVLAMQARVNGPNIRKSVGGPDLNFQFELAYIKENRKGRSDEEVFRYTGGAEYKIAEDLYIKFMIGGESGRDNGANQSFVMALLNWGFSSPPTK
jgi:hypothetical protein